MTQNNKSVEEILQVQDKQQVVEINREIGMLTHEIYEVVNSSSLTMVAKKDQIDLLSQRILRLIEGRCNILGRPYHTETGLFTVQISRLKNGLIDRGDDIKENKHTRSEEHSDIPIPETSKLGTRRPFVREKNKKFRRHKGLQDLFMKCDEAPFPVIAKAIGLTKTLRDYQPYQSQTIISLQKRLNPKIKKYWGMMLSSTKRLSGKSIGGLRLIRTKNS